MTMSVYYRRPPGPPAASALRPRRPCPRACAAHSCTAPLPLWCRAGRRSAEGSFRARRRSTGGRSGRSASCCRSSVRARSTDRPRRGCCPLSRGERGALSSRASWRERHVTRYVPRALCQAKTGCRSAAASLQGRSASSRRVLERIAARPEELQLEEECRSEEWDLAVS